MYFIVKVKFVNGDQTHPRHKIVNQTMTLEETLASLENIATDYIIKKLKPSFSGQDNEKLDVRFLDEPRSDRTKITYDVKYTMSRNKLDSNIIEIYEKVCKTEHKPGWVVGTSETITRTSQQIAYFCYIKYDNFSQTCDKCLTTISRPLPTKVISGNNPDLVKQLTSNGLFKKCQKSVAFNTLECDDLMSIDDLNVPQSIIDELDT